MMEFKQLYIEVKLARIIRRLLLLNIIFYILRYGFVLFYSQFAKLEWVWIELVAFINVIAFIADEEAVIWVNTLSYIVSLALFFICIISSINFIRDYRGSVWMETFFIGIFMHLVQATTYIVLMIFGFKLIDIWILIGSIPILIVSFYIYLGKSNWEIWKI